MLALLPQILHRSWQARRERPRSRGAAEQREELATFTR
jgi:hypothetical protein